MLLQLRSWLKRKFTPKQSSENSSQTRKPYQKPTARQLTPEQAKLAIMGHAVMGNKDAKELLEMIFRDRPKKDSERKSA